MASDRSTAQQTLADWRAGRLSRDGLYDHVYGALEQGVRRGFRMMMSAEPDPDELQEVMVRAFLELEAKDPKTVTSINGLAARVANFRARDYVRERISIGKAERSVEEDRAWQMNLMLAELDGENAERRGQLGDLAMDCWSALPPEQRDVVELTVLGRETLSDWAYKRGKSPQAASRQKDRAVNSIARCVAKKSAELDRGEEDRSNE